MRDEELLYRFLLGELAEDEAERLEQRLLQEDALFELCEAIEGDLLAASARGELTPEENERVLARFSASPGGRARLALARELVRAAEEIPARTASAPLPFRQVDKAPSRWVAPWAAIAAGLLLAAGLYQSVIKPDLVHREAEVNEPYGQAEEPRDPVVPPVPQAPQPQPREEVAEHPAPAPAPERPRAPAPAPVLPAAVFQLALDTLRGGEPVEALPRLEVPKKAEEIEIQLDLQGAEEESRTFNARVTSPEAGEVWNQREIEPQPLRRETGEVWGTGLILKIPAKTLPEGKYTMWVKAEGETDPIGSQDFEIVAE